MQWAGIILVLKRAFLFESFGQSGSSKFMKSGGGVHSQEETSRWQFNSANESLAIKFTKWGKLIKMSKLLYLLSSALNHFELRSRSNKKLNFNGVCIKA